MRYVSFETHGQATYGVWRDAQTWLAAPAAFLQRYPDLKSVIAADQLDALAVAAEQAQQIVTPATGRLLPVIPNPQKMWCVGLNYRSHVAEMKRDDSAYPAIFTRFADSLSAHEAPLLKPHATQRFDFEGELAVIIGKGGRRIAPTDAWSHIAGFTCFNDGTARDWQRHTHQWTPGKNFPSTGPLGPFMARRSAHDDVQDWTLETRLNGTVMQHARLADLIFPLPQLIAYLSGISALSPGDVIATGTPGGVGDKREPPLYLVAGDVMEVAITGLGTLRNIVVDEEVKDVKA